MTNITNITPPRVPLIDDRTGLISREWYRFFLNLFVVTGSGQSDTSITDLAVQPDTVDQTGQLLQSQQEAQLSYLTSRFDNLLQMVDQSSFAAPRVEAGTIAAQNSDKVSITGGSVSGLTTLGKRSTGTGAFDLNIANSENLTANRSLTVTLNDANRTIDLGEDFTYSTGTWTPAFTGLTVVLGGGSVTYSGVYTRIGRLVQFVAIVQPAGGATTQSTAGTTFHTLPITSSSSNAGNSTAANGGSLASYGVGIPATGSNFTPTWPAVTNSIVISGTYYL